MVYTKDRDLFVKKLVEIPMKTWEEPLWRDGGRTEGSSQIGLPCDGALSLCPKCGLGSGI